MPFLILFTLGIKAFEGFLASRIAARREISKRATLLGIFGTLIFGPAALLLPLVFATRFSRYPEGPVRDLRILDVQMKDADKRVKRLERWISKCPLVFIENHLNKRLAKRQDEYDSLLVRKASIYNPAIPHARMNVKDMNPIERSECLDVARKIDTFHSRNLANMDLTPEEELDRVKKTRAIYVDLCEKGKLEEHVRKMTI